MRNGFCSELEQLEKNRVKTSICVCSACVGWLCHGLTLFLLGVGETKIVPAYAFLFIKSAETVTDRIGLSFLITNGSQLPLSTIQSCILLVVVGYRVY